jgi:hypothetical protein
LVRPTLFSCCKHYYTSIKSSELSRKKFSQLDAMVMITMHRTRHAIFLIQKIRCKRSYFIFYAMSKSGNCTAQIIMIIIINKVLLAAAVQMS